MKTLTRKQLESRKEKAVRSVDEVLGDSNRAAEIANERSEDYAERRNTKIAENPGLRGVSYIPTKDPLLARIKDLENENDELQEQLDQVADIVAAVEQHTDESDSGHNEDEGND